MRSQKLLIVSATMLACTSLASVSFADDTKAHSGATDSSSTQSSATTGTTAVTSQTVMTPSSPSVPTTSTTITTQGSPGATTATTPATTAPTSTTTTTSADDATAAAPTPMTSMAPPTGESTTIYQKRTPNKAMLITGSALFVSTYVTTAALAGANGGLGDKDLYIPIVGPWINIAERTPGQYENNTRDTLLIAGSGVLQGVGAIMAVTSFFVPEKVPAARIQAGSVKMEITPQAGAGVGGLGAVGVF